MNINIGTSGYSYPYWGPHPTNPDIKNFYTVKTKTKWLEQYGAKLKSVEINCTRYRKLTPKMCKGWIEKVPEDFTITIKASTYITHDKKLCDFKKWWEEFYPCVVVLGNRFCSILFQFPPVFKKTPANLLKLKTVKKIIPSNVKCAFEFRDTSWYDPCEELKKLFVDCWTQVILTVPEIRHQEKFNFGNLPGGTHIGILNPNFTYFRFHGTTDYSSGTYGPNRLIDIIDIINTIDPKCLCAYFNNVDTWTLQRPYDYVEAEYTEATPVGVQLTPSAIYDSNLLGDLLKICSNSAKESK